MQGRTERRASPVVPPAPTRELMRARAEWAVELQRRLQEERGSMLRGLVLLAVAVLLVSGARAGWGRMFVARWWQQW